jgi:hypothetical protein
VQSGEGNGGVFGIFLKEISRNMITMELSRNARVAKDLEADKGRLQKEENVVYSRKKFGIFNKTVFIFKTLGRNPTPVSW